MSRPIDLLVIGAGPYGLATAILAKSKGLETVVVGKPMSLWRDHMPRGMILRSDDSWHFDPLGVHTYSAYVQATALKRRFSELITREEFIGYSEWILREKGLEIDTRLVSELHRESEFFVAELEDQTRISARNVLVAVGYQYFAHLPHDLTAVLPVGRYSHSSSWTDFSTLREKTCLIVGGRQSAYETAALIAEEAPGSQVYVSHRKPVPSFTHSDWGFVDEYVAKTLEAPAWYRGLTEEEKARIVAQFYGEGRLKLEPWLAPRVDSPSIHKIPETTIASCRLSQEARGKISVTLSNQQTIAVDHVILATGFAVDLSRIPFLSNKSIIPQIKTTNGFPVLDTLSQTTVPGLYFTGMSAMRDFGNIFGFVKGAQVGAQLVVRSLQAKKADRP